MLIGKCRCIKERDKPDQVEVVSEIATGVTKTASEVWSNLIKKSKRSLTNLKTHSQLLLRK